MLCLINTAMMEQEPCPRKAPERFSLLLPRRYDVLLEEMNVENVRLASPISVLRALARYLYAKFGRLVIAHYPNEKSGSHGFLQTETDP